MKFRMQVGVMDCLSCGNCVDGEVRFASVMKQFPNEAEELFAAAKQNAQWRYNNYRRLARQQWGQDPDELAK